MYNKQFYFTYKFVNLYIVQMKIWKKHKMLSLRILWEFSVWIEHSKRPFESPFIAICSQKQSQIKRKMKPLVKSQEILTWLCICPTENASKWKRFAHLFFTLSIILLVCSLMVSSVVYIFQFLLIDLENTLYAVGQIPCWSPVLYSFIMALIKRQKITALFTKLNKIYDIRKSKLK